MSTNTEPTARDMIADELVKREAQFAPWIDPDDTDGADVLAAVTERDEQFTSPRDEDESEEEYADRLVTDARQLVIDNSSEVLDEMILSASVSVSVVLRIELSTGGPGDYLTADLDTADGDIDNVRYHYVPWFDHADVHVPESSPLWALMYRYGQAYVGQSLDDLSSYGS